MRARRHRSSAGSLIVELGASSIFLMVFTILSVHLGLLMYGAVINDRACRDAARAAAQGQSPTQAQTMASTILISHNPAGSFVGAPTISAPVVYQDYSGSPPAGKSPYVQVSTSTQVHMPCALLQVCGETFRDGAVTFNQTYTFPIVRVK